VIGGQKSPERSYGAQETSPADPGYNCLAWSAKRDKNNWWQPGGATGQYWPPGVLDDYSFECFVQLFEKMGYKRSATPQLEILYEKVALYDDGSWFTHVSSQLPSGAWTSKLGPDEDIQHNSLQALEGNIANEYGKVREIMKRRCNLGGILKRAFFVFISKR
jgi:hypothetical protein